MQDASFIRITPMTDTHASIQCYFEDSNDLREELQDIAYKIYHTINSRKELVFLAYSKGMNDIEIHFAFGKDKKFMQYIVVHGFDNTNDLVQYLADLANSIRTLEDELCNNFLN